MLTVTALFSLPADVLDRFLWTCPPNMKYRIYSADEIHYTKESAGTTARLRRCQGTESPPSGDALNPAEITSLTDAANNVVTACDLAVASVEDGTFDFSAGDRLAIDFSEAAGQLAGCLFTIQLLPVGDRRHWVSNA